MAPILETIISLVFIFFIFSLIASWTVEFLAMVAQKRGKMLRRFIVDSLNDPFNKNWGLLLYAHPLIEVLHNDIRLPKGIPSLFYNTRLDIKRRLPAYIQSDQFATALIDIVINHNRVSKFRLDPVTKKQVLVTEPMTDKTFQDFLTGVEGMKESEVKMTLASLSRKVIAGREDAIDQLTQRIAEWYDNGMERLNGWYKRKIRKWLFAVGLIVAICFNVDTIIVAGRLYSDPQLRTVMVNAAEKYVNEHILIDSVYAVENIDSLKIKINQLKQVLDPLNLPIGWNITNNDICSKAFFAEAWEGFKKNAALKNILGWLITAFALSFGAPFWFDVLKKAVNMRSTGLKPASTNRISS